MKTVVTFLAAPAALVNLVVDPGPNSPTYDVYSVNGESLLYADITLKSAAEIAGISLFEIARALEEHGRCDTDEVTIVENRDVWPGPHEG